MGNSKEEFPKVLNKTKGVGDNYFYINLVLKIKKMYNINTMEEKKQPTLKITPSPKAMEEVKTDFNLDIDSEKLQIEKELEKLSPEDREKIGWGLNTFGFKIEKFKDDFFANIFDKITNKDLNKKSTTARFCKELRDSFMRDAKNAVKKAEDIKSGKEKHRLSNASLLLGNIVRYGRIVTDLTGKSLASPLRYVMMAGMATTRMAEAGKEARLKNEEVVEKTRIQDANLAAEEAWEIYQDALKKEGKENVSAEALKREYMMKMPKDILFRLLKNPSAANTFIQKILKFDIDSGLYVLNKNIEKIENNSKLSPEQKETEIEKLITKQKKNLEDYDRIITQYGTIDGLAMAGRYAQTAGKAVVAAVTVETLVLSAEKFGETISNIYHHFHDANEALAPVVPKTPTAPNHVPSPTAVATPEAPTPGATPEIKFVNEGIKFENGKGGIQGILDLKEQIRTQYNGDYSKAPENVQNFMDTDATKQAIKLGFFDPNNSDGKESARIMAGSILKFDEHGNLLFGKPDTSGNIPVLEKYHGTMFDSDHSASRNVGVAPKTTAQNIETYIDEETKKMEAEVKLKQQIEDHIDEETQKMNVEDVPAENPVEKPETPAPQNIPLKEELPPGTFRTGTSYGIGSKIGVGSEMPIGSGVHTGGDKAYVGDRIQVGSTAQIGGSYYGYEQGYFRDLSLQDNLFLEDHPEYSSNPFGLSGQELIQAHKISQKDMSYLFGNNAPSIWDKLSDLKAGKLMEQADPADNISDEGRMAQYLTLLRNFSDLSPKMGFWGGIGAENNEYYIARTMQKLIADGKLEKFEEILRK